MASERRGDRKTCCCGGGGEGLRVPLGVLAGFLGFLRGDLKKTEGLGGDEDWERGREGDGGGAGGGGGAEGAGLRKGRGNLAERREGDSFPMIRISSSLAACLRRVGFWHYTRCTVVDLRKINWANAAQVNGLW
ncbi:hypothetical protein GW17_00052661 [Ensete ventricosum]|nr:hypothetical protein GW17_00052661 [Ensete ventricosum]